MTIDDIKSWRKAERVRLMAARERLDGATRERFRQRIDTHLWRSFPPSAGRSVVNTTRAASGRSCASAAR